MTSTALAPQQILERAKALARSNRNTEIMDRVTILHGYLELTRLDPGNRAYLKSAEDAATSLLQATEENP